MTGTGRAPGAVGADADPLRILFLAPQPFYEVRGTPMAVRAFVETLGGLGHRIDLLTYPQGERVDLPGVRHRRSAWLPTGRIRPGASLGKLALDVPFLAEAVARLALGRYDAVHAVEEAAHLIAPFARLLSVPLVMDVDSSIPAQLRESGFAGRGPLLWFAESLDRYALRHAAVVVTVCDSLTRAVRSTAPDARVFQVEDPPLVDSRLPESAPAELRARYGIDEGPVALYTGNFEAYQGVELLVDAAAQVPWVTFVFVGGEPDDIERMRRRAAGGGSRCVFVGKRPPGELPEFLALADVVVSPRVRGDNTPFKVYTYLASGRPLVATRIWTHTQILHDALACLVEPTPEAIAAGVRDSVRHPDAARARALQGLALVEREYSPTRYREKVAAAYGQVQAAVTGRRG